MSENENEATAEGATPTSQSTTKESAAVGVLATIADRVKASAPEVVRRFVESRVEKEIDDRVDLLDKAMQKRAQLAADLRKIDRPDDEKFDANGKVAQSLYTRPRLEEIRKAKEALGKVEKAIELALSSNDWSKVKEACK